MTRRIFKSNYEELEDIYRKLAEAQDSNNIIYLELLTKLKDDLLEMVKRDSVYVEGKNNKNG